MASSFSLVSVFTLLVLSVLVATGAAMTEPASGASNNIVAAKVNGREIYFNQLKPNIDTALARYKKYGAVNVSGETKKRIQKEELDRQIDLELLAQAGEKSIGSEVESKVDERINAKHAVAGSKSEQAHVSLDKDFKNGEYRKQVRRQLFIDEYLAKQGLQELRVPESEVKKYYEQNRQSFKEAESVKVSHILIMLPKKPKAEEIAVARKKIEGVRKEVASGKSFAELATQYSVCASAAAGGDLGYITRGYMPQEFDKAAFALKPGEVSDVVRTRHGFHLVKAIDKKPERVQEIGEVKDFISKLLIKNVQAKWINEIAGALKREAKVEVYLK